MSNTRFWDVLGKTDPSQTKQFTRLGGFKGTAIKPMWANLRMTEFFGPCGIGWGMTEPVFQVHAAGSEMMVFCTVSIWYRDESGSTEPVYGVGGDKFLTQMFEKDSQGKRVKDAEGNFKTYPQSDDEAFKKAYTDALGNAMKFIGVGADVHMGLFDDSKYVQEMRQEFSENDVHAEVERQKAAPSATPPELDWKEPDKSGVMMCRILDAKKTKRKNGDGEVVTLKMNGSIEGNNLAYYFHVTHSQELIDAVGKVVKLVVKKSGKFLNVSEVLEIDGKNVAGPAPADGNLETQARLIASTLGFEEEELQQLFTRYCAGSWAVAIEKMQEEKVRRENAEL